MRSLFTLFIWSTLLACQSPRGNETAHFLQEAEIALAPVIVDIESVFFSDSTTVNLHLGLEETIIEYAIVKDSGDLDYQEYSQPIELFESTHLKIRASAAGFLPAAEQAIFVIKINDRLESAVVSSQPNPHEKYFGNGPHVLIDQKKGALNFQGDKSWIGYDASEIIIDLDLGEKQFLEQLTISMLEDHGSWIFLPKSIKVFGNGTKEIGAKKRELPVAELPRRYTFESIAIVPGNYDKIRLRIDNFAAIPDWHPGKGTAPWFFIDEIIAE